MANVLGFSFFGTCNGVSGFISPRDFSLPVPLHILVDTRFPFLWDVDVYRYRTVKTDDGGFVNFIGLYTKLDDFRGVREGAFGGVGVFVRDGYVDSQKAVALLKGMQQNLLAAASDNRKFIRTIDEARESGYLKAPVGFADLADSFQPSTIGGKSSFQISAQYILDLNDVSLSEPIGFIDFAQDEIFGRVSDLFFCSSPEVHSEIRKGYTDALVFFESKKLLESVKDAEKAAIKAAADAELARKRAADERDRMRREEAERARVAEERRVAEEAVQQKRTAALDRMRGLDDSVRELEAKVGELTRKRDGLLREIHSSAKSSAGSAEGLNAASEELVNDLRHDNQKMREALERSESIRDDEARTAQFNLIAAIICASIFFLASVALFVMKLSSDDDKGAISTARSNLAVATRQLGLEKEENSRILAQNAKLAQENSELRAAAEKLLKMVPVVPANPNVRQQPPAAAPRQQPASVTDVCKDKNSAACKREKEDKKRIADEKKSKELKESSEVAPGGAVAPPAAGDGANPE